MKRGAALVIGLLIAAAANAAGERKIRTLNIGLQGLMTLISGVAQGHVHSTRDALRCLGAGAAAGYGSFEAKVLVRNGAITRGWLLANAAASVSENAAAGRPPLAQLGYTFGPLRIRVDGSGQAYVDGSLEEVGALVMSIRDGDRAGVRSGMIAFERDTLYPRRSGVGPFAGYTWGIFPSVWTGASRDVRRHEIIHAIQSLQTAAVEPFHLWTYRPRDGRPRRIRFEHLDVDALDLANGLVLGRQRYENRWNEIEAYRLAQHRAP